RQDWTVAGKHLDKVIAFDPGNVELQQRAMVLLIQGGDATRAIAMARKVLEHDPNNVLALLLVNMDQMARQDYAEALETLTKMSANGVTYFVRPFLIAWAK